MGSGSSSDLERSKNAAPEEAHRPARTATKQRVDSITSVGMRTLHTEVKELSAGFLRLEFGERSDTRERKNA
jgi:hypothetical protein